MYTKIFLVIVSAITAWFLTYENMNNPKKRVSQLWDEISKYETEIQRIKSGAGGSEHLLPVYNLKIKTTGNLIDALLDRHFLGNESEDSYVEENRYEGTLINR